MNARHVFQYKSYFWYASKKCVFVQVKSQRIFFFCIICIDYFWNAYQSNQPNMKCMCECVGKNVHFLFQFERTIWRCIIHTALLSMVDEINVFGFGNIVLNSLWVDSDGDICISFKLFVFNIIKTVHLRKNIQSISYLYSFILQSTLIFSY